MDNNYVNKNELDIHEKLLCDIKYKPTTTLIFVFIFGFICCISLHPVAVALGIVLLAFSGFVYLKVDDYMTLSIYESFVLIYAYQNNYQVFKVDYHDVEEWGCKMAGSNSNAMMFRLKSGEIIYKDTFQTGKAFSTLNKIMPEKEMRTRELEKSKEKGIDYKLRLLLGKKRKS